MRNNLSRRKFFQTAAGAGLAVSLGSSMQANAASGKSAGAEKGLVFLFQGDSITDGNRGRNADPNHIMGHGYAFSVASRVGADFPAAGHSFCNRGISGNRVPDLQQRWQEDTLAIKPNVLSILVGINDTNAAIADTAGAPTAADFENGYRDLLQQAKNADPATLFVLGIPFVYPVGKRAENWQQWKEETGERAAKVRLLAGEFDAVLVDYPAVFDKAMRRVPAAYWIWDGIHPTVPAHELMAREWIRQTSRRLPFLKHYV